MKKELSERAQECLYGIMSYYNEDGRDLVDILSYVDTELRKELYTIYPKLKDLTVKQQTLNNEINELFDGIINDLYGK